MIKFFITVVLVGAAIWLGLQFKHYANKSMKEPASQNETGRFTPGKLPGLPAELEASLETAKRGGAEGLRNWMAQHRAQVEDPRLAELDLDYVVLVGPTDPAEAKRVLAALKERVPASSPLAKRRQQLEKAYP